MSWVFLVVVGSFCLQNNMIVVSVNLNVTCGLTLLHVHTAISINVVGSNCKAMYKTRPQDSVDFL